MDEVAALVSEEHEEMTMMASSSSGPLPSPEVMAAFQVVDPNLPTTIVEMARAEQRHRHDMERELLNAQKEEARGKRGIQERGQRYGLYIAVIGIVGAVIAAMMDKSAFAVTFGGAVLFSLVAVFVTGKIVRPKLPNQPPTPSPVPPIPKQIQGAPGHDEAA